MTVNRILYEWFPEIFRAVRTGHELDTTHTSIHQYFERSHILAILEKAGLITTRGGRPTRFRATDAFLRHTDAELMPLIKDRVPEGSIIETPVNNLRNVIVEWGTDRVRYRRAPGEFDDAGIRKKLEEDVHAAVGGMKNSEKERMALQRIGQDKLRNILLLLYNNKCAMCEVDEPELLRSSHIIPWAEREDTRLDPSNAILLCGLHDLAFEAGIVMIDDRYRINIEAEDGTTQVLREITHARLRLPRLASCHPKREYLKKRSGR